MPNSEELAERREAHVARLARPMCQATGEDDGNTAVDFIAMEHTPDKTMTAEVIPVGHTECPPNGGSPAAASRRTTRSTVKGNIALIQGRSACASAAEWRLAEGRARRADPLQRGHAPSREPALLPLRRPRGAVPDPGRALQLGRVGTKLYNLARATSIRRSSSPPRRGSPEPVPEERRRRGLRKRAIRGGAHPCSAGAHLDSVPARPGMDGGGLRRLGPARAGRGRSPRPAPRRKNRDPLPVVRRREGRARRLAVCAAHTCKPRTSRTRR